MVNLDAPSTGAAVANGQVVHIAGWAVDPAGPGPGVERVDLYLDGPPEAGGVRIGTATYGLARPDVAATFGRADWRNCGFALDWTPTNLTVGDYTIRASAQASSGSVTTSAIGLRVAQEYGGRCNFLIPCFVGPTAYGWELDYGGPSIYFERLPFLPR